MCFIADFSSREYLIPNDPEQNRVHLAKLSKEKKYFAFLPSTENLDRAGDGNSIRSKVFNYMALSVCGGATFAVIELLSRLSVGFSYSYSGAKVAPNIYSNASTFCREMGQRQKNTWTYYGNNLWKTGSKLTEDPSQIWQIAGNAISKIFSDIQKDEDASRKREAFCIQHLNLNKGLALLDIGSEKLNEIHPYFLSVLHIITIGIAMSVCVKTFSAIQASRAEARETLARELDVQISLPAKDLFIKAIEAQKNKDQTAFDQCKTIAKNMHNGLPKVQSQLEQLKTLSIQERERIVHEYRKTLNNILNLEEIAARK